MRTVPIKSTLGGLSLAHPWAPAGSKHWSCIVIHVQNVPDDIPAAAVLRQMSKVVILNHGSIVWPETVDWHAIANRPQGSIVNLATPTIPRHV